MCLIVNIKRLHTNSVIIRNIPKHYLKKLIFEVKCEYFVLFRGSTHINVFIF